MYTKMLGLPCRKWNEIKKTNSGSNFIYYIYWGSIVIHMKCVRDGERACVRASVVGDWYRELTCVSGKRGRRRQWRWTMAVWVQTHIADGNGCKE